MPWKPDYLTADELKPYVGIPLDDETDDALLAVAVTSGSRAVDGFCSGAMERQFGLTAPETRTYTVSYYDRCRYLYVYEIDDLMDTNIVVTADGEVTENYTLEPVNAPQRGKPYTRIAVLACESLAISGMWGWTSVPVPVVQATALQASRFFKRKDAPFGISGSPDVQGEMRLLARLDPDLQVALIGYRRTGAVG